MECKNALPYTVTKDFSRDKHLYLWVSRRSARLIRDMKRKAHRKERRMTKIELKLGLEPEPRNQVTGYDVI